MRSAAFARAATTTTAAALPRTPPGPYHPSPITTRRDCMSGATPTKAATLPWTPAKVLARLHRRCNGNPPITILPRGRDASQEDTAGNTTPIPQQQQGHEEKHRPGRDQDEDIHLADGEGQKSVADELSHTRESET